MTHALPWIFAAALGAGLSVHGFESQAQEIANHVSDEPVEGTNVRRARVETVLLAPFDVVAARMTDYVRYPGFMPRFRSVRVVRRDHADTDLYVQLELPSALGVFWFVHRLSSERVGDRLVVRGVSIDGNIGRVETSATIERLPGPVARTRFVFTLFGVAPLPLPSSLVTEELRSAVEGVADALRERVEVTVMACVQMPHWGADATRHIPTRYAH